MTAPPTYNRLYNFTNAQAVNPTGPNPGNWLDAEYSQIKVTLDALIANLGLIQRSDGALANGSVSQSSLSSSLSIGFNFRGPWATATNYAISDGVFYGAKFYICLQVNLSASLTPDLDTTNWKLGADMNATNISISQAAAAAALVSQNAAAVSAAAALVSQNAALVSQNAAAASALAIALSPFTFRNRLVNGDMRIDQRNAGNPQTFTAGAALAYAVDRWYGYCTGANVTGQRVAGTLASQNRYQFTGAASVTTIGFAQRIATADSFDLNNSTCTFAVDLANSLLTTVTWSAYYATTTDSFGTLGSPTKTLIATGTFTVNATLARYSAQIAIPSAATTGVEIVLSVGAQTSGTWTIGNAQLEPGATATVFEKRPPAVELALAQHRHCMSYSQGTIPGTATQVGLRIGAAASITVIWFGALFPVVMAAPPNVTFYSEAGTSGKCSAGSLADTAAASGANVGDAGIWAATSSGLTAAATYVTHFVADAEL